LLVFLEIILFGGFLVVEVNRVYNMDCLEYMKGLEDNCIDLVLTDPPYGIGMDGGNIGGNNLGKAKEYHKKDWDKSIPSKELFDEILRVSKKSIIFGANHFIQNIPYNSSCWIVWDKDNTGNFADSELAWSNFNTAVRNYKFRWNGMLQQDMANKEERHHPTQKPVELFKMILRDYAIKNNYKTVYDPFMGSGTTALACKSLGLNYIGTELDKDYFNIINKRLEQVQGSLF